MIYFVFAFRRLNFSRFSWVFWRLKLLYAFLLSRIALSHSLFHQGTGRCLVTGLVFPTAMFAASIIILFRCSIVRVGLLRGCLLFTKFYKISLNKLQSAIAVFYLGTKHRVICCVLLCSITIGK